MENRRKELQPRMNANERESGKQGGQALICPVRTFVLAALLATATWAWSASASGEAALTNWMVAQTAFQKAGALMGEKKFEPAKAAVASAAQTLPPPYSAMATQIVQRIDAMVKETDARTRLQEAAKICASLQSYEAAVSLWPVQKTATPDDDDDVLPAWYLVETGKFKEAIAAYQAKLTREQVTAYQEYYRKQIELLQTRAANQVSISNALTFAQEHYLKGFEEKADPIGALREMSRVVPLATNSQFGVHVYQQIIDCLSALNDDAGLEAWENKLLSDFKLNSEACATVFFDRGIKAYHARRDLAGSLALFRKVCTEFPTTKIWGDAQYSAGLVLQEQQKYDEAIAAFGAIFPSHVNDYDLSVGSSDDYKNYRFKSALRTSECYSSKKDFKKAIEFAEMARDRYIVASYCKTCLHEAKESVNQRIAGLKAKAAAEGK